MTGSPNGRLSLLVVLGDNALFPMSRRLLGEQVGVSPEQPLGICCVFFGRRGAKIARHAWIKIEQKMHVDMWTLVGKNIMEIVALGTLKT